MFKAIGINRLVFETETVFLGLLANSFIHL